MKNILFIRLRLLGDVIFTIPAVQLYLGHFPDHAIHYVVEEEFKEIADLIPGIHRVMTVPRRMGLGEILEFRKAVRAIGFDTVIDFHSGPKSALLTRATGIATRIGYRTPNRNWAFNRLVPRWTSGTHTHSVYNQARLLGPVGIDVDDGRTKIPGYPAIRISDLSIADSVRSVLEVPRKIVIHVGAGNRFRDWGFEKFDGLLGRLAALDAAVILIGHTEAERDRGRELEKNHKVSNLTGGLKIKETLYLISQSQVYVGIDSGPLHLASLTDTPIVGLYGPNVTDVSGPWRSRNVSIVETGLSCRPCSQRRCRYDTIRCMKEIEVDTVYEAVKNHLR